MFFLKKLLGFSIGPIIGAMISFLTVPITTYFILPQEFGKASIFSAAQSLIITFVYFGIDQSYTREYNHEDDKIQLFQNALIIPMMVSLVFSLVLIILKNEFSVLLFGTDSYANISILFGLLISFSILERFILLSIRMEEKALEYSFFNIFVKVTILFVTLILIMMQKRTFLTIIYSTIFGQFIGDIFLILRYRYLFIMKRNWIDISLIKKMFIFGFPLIFAASLNNLLNTSGRFFLRAYSSFYEIGLYDAALKISNIVQVVQVAFTSFWVPTAYRWFKEKRSIENYELVSKALLFFLTLVFYFMLFFNKFIILILSSNYSEAQYLIGLLVLPPILYMLSETTTLGIVFSRKSHYNLYISLFSLIPSLFLNWILIPKFGNRGAALSVAISYVIFCLLRNYYSSKTGFKLDFKIQLFNIFLFLIAAIISSFNITFGNYLIFLLFLISLVSQKKTIKNIGQLRNLN